MTVKTLQRPLCQLCVKEGRTICWYAETKSIFSTLLSEATNMPNASEGEANQNIADTRAGTDNIFYHTAVERKCTRLARRNLLCEN